MGEKLVCTHGEYATVPTGNGNRYVCVPCGAFGIGEPFAIRWYYDVINQIEVPDESRRG